MQWFCVCIAAFKKEFSKLGGSFVALARAFDHDKRSDSTTLSQAIEHTGRTYEDIGKLHEEQPKHDMAHLMEGLQEYKGILSTLPDALSVYKVCRLIDLLSGPKFTSLPYLMHSVYIRYVVQSALLHLT